MGGAEQAERAVVLLAVTGRQRLAIEIDGDLLESAGSTEFEDGAFACTILRRSDQRRQRVEHECDQQKTADELAEGPGHGRES